MSSLQSSFAPVADGSGRIAFPDVNNPVRRTVLATSVLEPAKDGVILTSFGYRDATTTRVARPQ